MQNTILVEFISNSAIQKKSHLKKNNNNLVKSIVSNLSKSRGQGSLYFYKEDGLYSTEYTSQTTVSHKKCLPQEVFPYKKRNLLKTTYLTTRISLSRGSLAID